MGLAAQEQLAKSNEARDMQDGAWRQIVQLEAVILQETLRNGWIGNPTPLKRKETKHTRSSLEGLGKFSARASPLREVNPAQTETRSERKISLRLKFIHMGAGHRAAFPVAFLGSWGREEELGTPAMFE